MNLLITSYFQALPFDAVSFLSYISSNSVFSKQITGPSRIVFYRYISSILLS